MFVQVIPLLSYGPSFNFSIWYVELLGLENDLIVCRTLQNYNEQKEKTTIRLILKHLRSKGHFEAFRALSNETSIQLEDAEITDLYQCLVDAGNFEKVEKIMEKLIDGETREAFGNFNSFVLVLQKDTLRSLLRSKNTKQSSQS